MSSTSLATALVVPLDQLRMTDVEVVGGKNASLGEMISQLAATGVRVPGGFATTAHAFREFLKHGGLTERINNRLAKLNVDDVKALAEAGAEIRAWISDAALPPMLEAAIRSAFATLSSDDKEASYAVRSSATAEDLPDASFAGQQETFLNVSGIEDVLHRIKAVFASSVQRSCHQLPRAQGLRAQRRGALGGRAAHGALRPRQRRRAVHHRHRVGLRRGGVHHLGLRPRRDGGAGKRQPRRVLRAQADAARRQAGRSSAARWAPSSSAWSSRRRRRRPKPASSSSTVDTPPEQRNRYSLSDDDVLQLARYALVIEQHYKRPMDIEWGRDGRDGKLYILQARPETVKSQAQVEHRYKLKGHGTVLTEGRAIGQKIGTGRVRVVHSSNDMDRVHPGDVLVTEITDPNWEPVMKRAAAIVTNRGGRTCHAAIIARELGIPAVVGCGDATDKLADGSLVTVSCAEGDTGYIYEGLLETEVTEVKRGQMPYCPIKLMMNVGNPSLAFEFARIPNSGVGLARLEFIINTNIGVHPKAILDYPNVDPELKIAVESVARGHASPRSFYVDKLIEGVATIAAAFWPKPVIVRLSDFKSNEYKKLIGGSRYEPDEENPMLGFRGASPLHQRRLRRRLRDGVRGAAPRPRRDGSDQRGDHGAFRAHGAAGRTGQPADGRPRPGARQGRAARDHDVRGTEQRDPGRPVPAALRRHVDRLQRPDAAHAGLGP
jgi:pyruvate,water dikinase